MKRLLILVLLLFTTHSYAAVYHIDPTVGSSGDGSAASPLKAWTNLPTMATGDDVYFKCGTTLVPTAYLHISWQGTSSDPVVIGSYWMDGATAKYELNGDRPIISGSDWTVPTQGGYTGLITVSDKDYVQIRNLHIYRSGAYGIYIYGNSTATATSYGFIVDGCKVEAAWRQSIICHRNPSNYGVISNNEVTSGNQIWVQTTASDWGAVVTVLSCPTSYTTVKNNLVYSNFGEGISSVSPDEVLHNGYATIENNIVYDNRALQIYISRTEGNIVRNNLILGNGSPSGTYRGGTGRYLAGGRYWNGGGIEINNEVRDVANDFMSTAVNDNLVYNNLIAGTYSGLGLSSGWSVGARTMDRVWFYNNTVIGCYYSLIFLSAKLSSYTITDSTFKNNVFFVPSDTISYSTNGINGDASWVDTKLNPDYNAWTGSSPTYAGGSNDVVLSATDTGFEKTSGWQALTGVIDDDNFKLKSTSSMIDEGTDLSAVFTSDYFAETRPASWDIGADEYIPPAGLPTNTATAHYMSSAPTIDGTLTEWASIEGFELVDATTGKTGTYKIAFDGTYLYISGSVADTTLNSTRETRDSDIYNDDSFELVLGSAIAVDDNKETTDHKLTLNIGGYSADNVGDGTTTWDSSWTPAVSQAFVNTGTLNDASADTGYAFEARISWADIGATAPVDDAVWQFDFRQNDRDDSDVMTAKDFWNNDGANFNNPTGWGRLLFEIPTGGGSTSGIISLYDFEASALVTDGIGTNTLTNNATITESTDSRRGEGSADLEAGSSQYFSRTDANLSSGFPGKSGETNKDFTIGCWFKGEAFAAQNTLLSKYSGTSNDRTWHLSVREVSTGSGTYAVKSQLGFNSGTEGEDIAHASTLSASTWYFAAMSYNNTTQAYAIRVRDNQCREVGTDLEDTATLDANGLSITDADFKIGALGETTQFFDGLIDYAFVYNEPLDETAINALCGSTRRSRGAAMMMGW